MAKVIVADTGPLIALSLIDLLAFLPEFFSHVYVPETVFAEATVEISKPGAVQIQTARQKRWPNN
jgi:predicted nucleic acid-binding protein